MKTVVVNKLKSNKRFVKFKGDCIVLIGGFFVNNIFLTTCLGVLVWYFEKALWCIVWYTCTLLSVLLHEQLMLSMSKYQHVQNHWNCWWRSISKQKFKTEVLHELNTLQKLSKEPKLLIVSNNYFMTNFQQVLWGYSPLKSAIPMPIPSWAHSCDYIVVKISYLSFYLCFPAHCFSNAIYYWT